MKIKVVQIAAASKNTGIDIIYLDDKGRVWRERTGVTGIGQLYKEWVQIELPEEPENA